MKTSEFIKLLQEEDPEGTANVTVGGDPVWYVERLPGYYDGSYIIEERDPELTGKCFDIRAVRYTKEGYKLNIHRFDYAEHFYDDPEFPVLIDDSIRHDREGYQKAIDKAREETRVEQEEIITSVVHWAFERWAYERLTGKAWNSQVKTSELDTHQLSHLEYMFEQFVLPRKNDVVPADLRKKLGPTFVSEYDRQFLTWDRMFSTFTSSTGVTLLRCHNPEAKPTPESDAREAERLVKIEQERAKQAESSRKWEAKRKARMEAEQKAERDKHKLGQRLKRAWKAFIEV